MTHVAFEVPREAYDYRPLKRGLAGWDVYALQTGLLLLGFELPDFGADGRLGRETSQAIRRFQRRIQAYTPEFAVDGIAGIATQRELGHRLARRAAVRHGLPPGVPLGHVEKECGFQLGNHSAMYTDEAHWGTWDVGPVQMNTRYRPVEDGFNCASIDTCAGYVASKWVEYDQLGIVDERRALELACGAWNAPAWTDRLARGLSITDTQRAWIEAYIDRVTVYL